MIIPFPFFIPNAVASSTPWKYMGNGGISICILNLCSRWRWIMYFMPQPLQSLIEGFMGPRHGVNVVAKRHLNPYQWCNPDYLMLNFFFFMYHLHNKNLCIPGAMEILVTYSFCCSVSNFLQLTLIYNSLIYY
jgi:hypothetical protein